MRHLIQIALVAGLAGCYSGDEISVRDRAMNELADAMEAASSSFVIAPANSPAQWALLQEGLVKQSARYQILSASPDKLDLLREVERLIPDVSNNQSLGSQELERIMKRTSDLKAVGAEALGRLPDAGRRDSVLFRLPTGKLGMLSVWDYEADRGKMRALKEAWTFNIAGNPASLSLSSSRTDVRRLWNLAWATNAEYYRLYLEDAEPSTGRTYWNPDTIRALAEQMTR